MSDLNSQLTLAPIIASIVALVLAGFFYFRVKGLPEGTDTMNLIGQYIREGAMAFLVREYKVLAVYTVVVFIALFFAFQSTQGTGMLAGVCFVLGAALSLLAGFVGMKAATYANVRTSQAAREGSKPNALLTALDGGAVMGLCVAATALLGLGGRAVRGGRLGRAALGRRCAVRGPARGASRRTARGAPRRMLGRTLRRRRRGLCGVLASALRTEALAHRQDRPAPVAGGQVRHRVLGLHGHLPTTGLAAIGAPRVGDADAAGRSRSPERVDPLRVLLGTRSPQSRCECDPR